MADMLVKLYPITLESRKEELEKDGIQIKRALAADTSIISKFILGNFHKGSQNWVDECTPTLTRHPTNCFIATQNREVIGFCCYDGTAKGMLGPLGVSDKYRGKGIAKELIYQTLEAMKADGYAYAVIGWVSSEEYYAKACGAVLIPDSEPGIYQRLITS